MKKSIHSAKSKKLQELLIRARMNAGLTQQEVADKLGKPQSFVAKYELGERRLDVIEFIMVASKIGTDPMKILKMLLK